MKIARIDLNKCNLSVNLASRHTEMEISKIHVAETQHSCVNENCDDEWFPSSWQIITAFLLNDYTQPGPIRW